MLRPSATGPRERQKHVPRQLGMHSASLSLPLTLWMLAIRARGGSSTSPFRGEVDENSQNSIRRPALAPALSLNGKLGKAQFDLFDVTGAKLFRQHKPPFDLKVSTHRCDAVSRLTTPDRNCVLPLCDDDLARIAHHAKVSRAQVKVDLLFCTRF